MNLLNNNCQNNKLHHSKSLSLADKLSNKAAVSSVNYSGNFSTASISSLELKDPSSCSSVLSKPAANRRKGRRKKEFFNEENFNIISQLLISKIPIDSECRQKYTVILDSSSRRADEVEKRVYMCELCQHRTNGECE